MYKLPKHQKWFIIALAGCGYGFAQTCQRQPLREVKSTSHPGSIVERLAFDTCHSAGCNKTFVGMGALLIVCIVQCSGKADETAGASVLSIAQPGNLTLFVVLHLSPWL